MEVGSVEGEVLHGEFYIGYLPIDYVGKSTMVCVVEERVVSLVETDGGGGAVG